MALTHYEVGDVAVLDAEFESDGTATDPATVVFSVLAPDGAKTTYAWSTNDEVGRTGPGVFFCEVPVTMAGYWRYRAVGDEPAPGSASGIFACDPDPFDADAAQLARRRLCTLEEAKEYADEALDDSTKDALFQRLIDDCAEAFYRYTAREFTPQQENPFERLFDIGHWEHEHRCVAVGDLASTTGLQVVVTLLDGTPIVSRQPDGTVEPASIVALPRNRDSWQPVTELWFPQHDVAWPAQIGRRTVLRVEGDWGFPAVPSDVRQYAVEQVAIWFERDIAKFSGTFSLAEGHTLRPRALDDAIRDGLDLYRVTGIG